MLVFIVLTCKWVRAGVEASSCWPRSARPGRPPPPPSPPWPPSYETLCHQDEEEDRDGDSKWTWWGLRAQYFWRDVQVLWRSGCSSSNPMRTHYSWNLILCHWIWGHLGVFMYIYCFQYHLSQVFLVWEVIHQKNFLQELCWGPAKAVSWFGAR